MRPRDVAGGLVRACHPLPALAVTVLAGLLAAGAGGSLSRTALLVAVVATGQLVIGWSNDLVDAERDRTVGRPDKPLVRGLVVERQVQVALALATAATVVLSLLAGLTTAWLHLGLVVGSGVAYNLGVKSTAWSWVPYAVAFGALPAVAWQGVGAGWPPAWVLAVGSLLGVGAHLLNVLPDLAEDEQTGIRGLPHRLGAGLTQALAPLLLLVGSVVVALAPRAGMTAWSLAALTGCSALAVLAWTGRGRTPFVAAIGMAVVNVVSMVVRS